MLQHVMVSLNVAACGGLIHPLNVELNPICHLRTLLGAHHILHVGSIRVKIALGFIWVSNEVNQLHTNSQYIYFNFCTYFGQLCAHHQHNLLYLCALVYFTLCGRLSGQQTRIGSRNGLLRTL